MSSVVTISRSAPNPVNMGYTACTKIDTLNALSPIRNLVNKIISALKLIFPSVVMVLYITGVLSEFRNGGCIRSTFCKVHPAIATLVTITFISIIGATLKVDFNKKLTRVIDLPTLVLFTILFTTAGGLG